MEYISSAPELEELGQFDDMLSTIWVDFGVGVAICARLKAAMA
jgi:hypothetical protein